MLVIVANTVSMLHPDSFVGTVLHIGLWIGPPRLSYQQVILQTPIA